MKASIIIPSYNACERLYYNLLSLNMQNYDKRDFEVIVADNASKDDTKKLLLNFKANFDLKPVFLNENKGRSHARNCAIDKAAGKILIFHDSDMIAEKDYVSKHIEAHDEPETVVIGQNWSRIYTYYYKDFKGYLMENFIDQQKKIGNTKFPQYKDSQSIIDKEEIINGDCFKKSFILYKYQDAENDILQSFGSKLEGYEFPWSLFATNNCSASREAVVKAGAFDEAFVTWGCEDLDLGYRLFKNGCRFIKANEIISIHQEHPVDFGRNPAENVHYFTKKYNSLDLLVFYYGHLAEISRQQVNPTYRNLKRLEDNEELKWFIELYKRLFVNIRDRTSKTNENINLCETRELKQYIIFKKEEIKDTLSGFERGKEFHSIARSFRALLRRGFGPHIGKI